MIKLNEKLEYDDTLTFKQQSEEVKTFIIKELDSLLPTEEIKEPAGFHSRVVSQKYDYKGIIVTRTYIYVNAASHEENGAIKEELYG